MLRVFPPSEIRARAFALHILQSTRRRCMRESEYAARYALITNSINYVIGLWPPVDDISIDTVSAHVRNSDAWHRALDVAGKDGP